MGKRERERGAEFERELSKLFHELGYPSAKRRLGQARDSGHDLEGTGRWVVEAKRRNRTAENSAWLEQVHAAARRTPDALPIVIVRPDKEEPYVMMRWKTFREIQRTVNDPDRQPSLDDLL